MVFLKKQLAQEIVNNNSDYKLHKDYSGRGMFGRKTFAVEVPSRDDVGYLRKKHKGLKWDNLGLDFIVY